MPTTETRRITINVDAGQTTSQLKAISDQLGGMNKNTKDLADTFNLFSALSGTFIGGLGIQQLAGFSDQIQTLSTRLLTLTGDQDEATILLGRLQQAAQATNSSLQDTSDLYTRMSIALKEANIDSSVMIDFTETLVNTFRLSGSSADEAAGKVTSLAYAMQQGGLRGRELRTVLRDDTELGNLLKAAFGGNLMQAANNGFITTAALMKIIYANMGDVNSRAQVLTATFGQSTTKVLDAFKIQLYALTSALNGPGSFALAMNFVVQNMNSFIVAGSILALTTIPAIISGIAKIAAGLSLINPITALIAFEALVLYFSSGATSAQDFFTLVKVGFADLEESIDNAIAAFYEFSASIAITRSLKDSLTQTAAAYRNAATDHLVHAKALLIEEQAQEALTAAQVKGTATTAQWQKSIEGASKIKFDDTAFQMLAKLNEALSSGKITLEQYNQQIQSVDFSKMRKEFETGHADAEKLSEALDKFNIYDLGVQLKDGVLSFQQFDDAIRNIALGQLNRQLASGSISLETYNAKIAAVSNNFTPTGAFRTGLQDYVNAIGTTTSQVAAGITQAFKNVEDALVDFTKTGKFNFDKFTQDILDDLLRIIIRMSIIQPIAQGLLGYIGTPGATPTTSIPQGPSGPNNYIVNPNAHGNIYNKGLTKFAAGGIVQTPTLFGYGGGQTGMMGEAGPEAIIPLARGSGGDLGIKAQVNPVTINIVNQNGSQVDQNQTTGPNGDKQIEIMITSKVRSAIGTGQLDKALKSAYGLNRKGS